MRKSLWALALLAIVAFASTGKAQEETPKAELYGGYNYIQVTDRGSAYNFNGGSGQLAYNVTHWIGVAGDLGGYYTGNGFRAGLFSYLFGPRISLRRQSKWAPFAQALFGGARSIDNSPLNAFAMTVGGGVEYRVSEHFSIRPVQAEYFLTKFMDGGNNRQNNFRYSGGIVFRLGTR